MESLKRFFFDIEDHWFDWRHGIKTRGIIPSKNTTSAHTHVAIHATAYQAVWTRNLRVLIRESRHWTSARLFIDVGAGKGKACIYAAAHFDHVIGVEYVAEFLVDAKKNQQRAGYSNITFQHANAALYDLPEEAAMVFLFNPFDAVILDRFLTRNESRLRTHQCILAYANDRERGILTQHGFDCVFRDPVRSISLWR